MRGKDHRAVSYDVTDAAENNVWLLTDQDHDTKRPWQKNELRASLAFIPAIGHPIAALLTATVALKP